MKRFLPMLVVGLFTIGARPVTIPPSGTLTLQYALDGAGQPIPKHVGETVVFVGTVSSLPPSPWPGTAGWIELQCTRGGVEVPVLDTTGLLAEPQFVADLTPELWPARFVLGDSAHPWLGAGNASCEAYLFYDRNNKPRRRTGNTLAAIFFQVLP